MFKKTIGILGGMGPVASADTYTELIKICQKKYKAVEDSDFPAVILYSLPLQDFSHTGFSENSIQQKKIVNQLVNALKKLENAGAEIIIIDCNTVHYFFDDLQKSVNAPIVNLIDITVDKVKKNHYNKVAVLCSEASKNFGLYTKPLLAAGIEVLNTSKNDQELVNEAILAVMSGGVATSHIANLNSIIDRFISDGAKSIILGCTEISNLAKKLNRGDIFLDSEMLAIEKALTWAR